MNADIQPSLVDNNQSGGVPPRTRGPMHNLAITGFVLSFICGIAGLIVCIIARSQINASGGLLGGKGFATAGIFISIASIIVNTLYVIAQVS